MSGPTFHPTLIANNEPYLAKRATSLLTPADSSINSETGTLEVKKYLSRSLLRNGHQFYYDAMMHLVQKQKRLLDHIEEEKAHHIPQINEKSRALAEADP